ncbi:hypothetical protein CATMQ487_48510 [Sphaerotilus microaerophilus]|uniref:Uncharacterized protein n=1 Tax=Sphaerotilus microaerophilus TaxID=2914710 RepID=A0ABM7YT98_9BURK|nr:hypothetical protein CATMQ487_48510 [Sphaerotilus sp. FB-5]
MVLCASAAQARHGGVRFAAGLGEFGGVGFGRSQQGGEECGAGQGEVVEGNV